MRTLSGLMLAAGLMLVAGCGKSDAPPEAKSPGDPQPATTATPASTQPVGAQPPATWDMDPAKHLYMGKLESRINGDSIVPDIQVERGTVRVRTVNKEGSSVTVFEIHLTDPTRTMESISTTVKPDQMPGLEVPNVILFNPNDPAAEPKILDKGYALTLSIGKREKGKLSGRIQLCIADEKQSFVAGSFTADWIRAVNEPPGADDIPFVQGKFTVTGVTDPNVWLGYIRVNPDMPTILDVVGTDLKPGIPATRSDGNRPRMGLLAPGEGGSKDPARFEFTRLEPGRYCVFATVQGGPATYKWVTIEPTSQLAFDLAINTAVVGSLEITAPGAAKALSIVPVDDSGKPWPADVASNAASIIGSMDENKKPDATKVWSVTRPRLAPGKYEVWAGELSATVEVKANETTKVDLMKK